MPDEPLPAQQRPEEAPPPCDICGSTATAWIKCKLVCQHCHTILMSCGDL